MKIDYHYNSRAYIFIIQKVSRPDYTKYNTRKEYHDELGKFLVEGWRIVGIWPNKVSEEEQRRRHETGFYNNFVKWNRPIDRLRKAAEKARELMKLGIERKAALLAARKCEC